MTSGGSEASVYYQHGTSIASRVSWHVRQKMFRLFMDYFRPGPETSVLDVGVTSDDSFQESNYFEKLYPYPQRITCIGTEDGSHLEQHYPGLKYSRVKAGEPLKFTDGAYDIVFSNAVIEHVGSRAAQSAFVRELCRVARAFFITTPNRWFPVEHHTGLPLLHWLPASTYRRLLRSTRFSYWAEEAHLNLFTAREFAGVFPEHVEPVIRQERFAGVCSNLVAMGRLK